MGIDGMRIQSTILKPFVSTTTDYAKRILHKLFIVGTTTMKYVLNKTMPGLKSLMALNFYTTGFRGGSGIPLPPPSLLIFIGRRYDVKI